jgi:hypothetical protein
LRQCRTQGIVSLANGHLIVISVAELGLATRRKGVRHVCCHPLDAPRRVSPSRGVNVHVKVGPQHRIVTELSRFGLSSCLLSR